MAFVIAGAADCPAYARVSRGCPGFSNHSSSLSHPAHLRATLHHQAELMADHLSRQLPHYRVRKVLKEPAAWPGLSHHPSSLVLVLSEAAAISSTPAQLLSPSSVQRMAGQQVCRDGLEAPDIAACLARAGRGQPQRQLCGRRRRVHCPGGWVGGWVSRVSAGPPEFLFANPSFQPPMLLDGGVVQIIY